MWSIEGSAANCGRRRRLLNMVKTTKDVYIPAVQNSLSQAKLSLKNYYNSYEQTGENAQHDRYFSNMEDRELHLVCYPSYTRIGSDKEYITQVRGCVYAPGQMNRRNRLVLSICKQLIRPTATAETEKELESVFSDDIVPSVYSKGTMSSLSTVNSSTSSSASSSLTVASGSTIGSLQQEEVLRERLSGFLNKSIPNVPIIVDLLDDNGNQETEFTSTDCYGHFQIHKKTNFLPRLIRVIVDIQSPISTQYDTNMVEDAGIAVISDIDDTIKHTGVVGDKRSMFCNVFVNSFSSWLIPGMSLWYNTLKDAEDVDFFYVSNSPYQIYPTLRKYVSTEYPMGPMFLKQYAGNMLCSLISSSAKLKIPSIAQICKDFPNKKFILVGDSGEEDLEAYISTARTFPKQIIGIYIRCCKDSMSDDPMNDWDVMEELNYIISEKYLSVIRRNKNTSVKKNPPPVPPKKICLPSRIEEEIRRSRLSKLSLPTASTASSPVSIANNNRIPSVGRKFAYEESNTPSTCTAPPPLPPRHSNFPASLQIDADSEIFTMPSTQNDYGIYSSCFDRKADQWKERVIKAINILQESKVDARFVFFKDPDICIEDSIAKIRSLGRGR